MTVFFSRCIEEGRYVKWYIGEEEEFIESRSFHFFSYVIILK